MDHKLESSLSISPSASSDKKALKEQKKAETKARLEAEEAARHAADFARANYGSLPLLQSSDSQPQRTWTLIKNLNPESDTGKRVLFRARLHTARPAGKTTFVVLRQQNHTLQAVLSVNESTVSKAMVKFAASIPKESIVEAEGVLVKADPIVASCTEHVLEVHVDRLFIFSPSAEVLPFQLDDASKQDIERVGLDTRLNNRIIDLRTPANLSIFRIQSAVCQLFREHFVANGFTEIHTPKIISAASEGGSNVFKVSYFKGEAFLAQSPQLYKQMAICADFGRVFEIAPVFRAENSLTHRHMTEFVGVDLEMAFDDHYHQVMHFIGEAFVALFDGLASKFAGEIAAVNEQYPVEQFRYLPKTLVLEFAEGVEMLRQNGYPSISPLEDLSTEQEKALGKLVAERYGTDFYALDKFPLSVRPFYTMPDAQRPGYANAYDFFMRGEEILSGAQRIHDYSMLVAKAQEHKIDLKTIESYLDTFKYGAPAHAGGGIGLERVVLLYLGLGNIRRSCMFPRDPKRITP